MPNYLLQDFNKIFKISNVLRCRFVQVSTSHCKLHDIDLSPYNEFIMVYSHVELLIAKYYANSVQYKLGCSQSSLCLYSAVEYFILMHKF